MINLIIHRPCEDDTIAMQSCMAVVEQAIQHGYVEGPSEEAVNDIVLGPTKCTIEFNNDHVLDSASLAQMSKQKIFSSVIETCDEVAKTFSIRTIAERLRFSDLPLPKQFRKLLIDNKRYYKMALPKLIEKPEKFVALRQLFITDFMQFFTEIMSAVGEGEEKLAEAIGINKFAPRALKAARLLQRDIIMMNKMGGAPKMILERAQSHFAVFIDAITDVAFPGWRVTFKDKIDTHELEINDEEEETEGEEKKFSETKNFANEQRGEEAEGETIEFTPAEERILERESRIEGDGEAIFSATGAIYEDATFYLHNTKTKENAKEEFKNITWADAKAKVEEKYPKAEGWKVVSTDGNAREEDRDFSAKKTCSSLIKGKRQFTGGINQNQRQQMNHTQEELESHPEIPGSMGVHEDKNELKELNPLDDEKADTGKDVSAKLGEDHGHGITPTGEKTFGLAEMPMETNEYQSVDRTEKKTKTASALVKGKKKLFSKGLYLKITGDTPDDVIKFLEKLNNITVADYLKNQDKILQEYERFKSQIQEGKDKKEIIDTLDEALLKRPQNFLPVSEDPTILENAPVLRSEAKHTNGKELVEGQMSEILEGIKELHDMNQPQKDGNALPGNLITKEALSRVPGVGPQLAEAIMDYFNIREHNADNESRKQLVTKLKQQISGTGEMIDDMNNDEIIELTSK